MANTILTPQQITREALRVLHQQCNFISNVNRQYDSRFVQGGAKIGASLDIRLPAQYTTTTGAALSTQDFVEEKTTLTVATQRHVDVTFTTAELTLSLDDFSSRHIQPAMAVLAANIEADALTMYRDVYQHITSDGGVPTFRNLLQMRKALVDALAPMDRNVSMLLNTTSNLELVDALKGLFNSQEKISAQNIEGMLGRTAGMNFFENTLMPIHTAGTSAATGYLVNAATTTSGATSIIVDTGTGTLKAGDIITIAGVNRVHPETKADTGQLMTFTVTADYAGGGGTVSVSPAFNYTANGRQNITAMPADNAAITKFLGNAATVTTDLAFHRDAFAFVTADLEDVAQYGAWGARDVMDGISMRIARQYAISTDTVPCRIDVLYGYKAVRPQLAARGHFA